MTNEELLKTEQSVEPVPLLGIFATEIPAYLKGSVCRLMDAARKDEAEKYYIHARLTKEESEKIISYKATEVKFISGEIGVSVYCKNEKGKWIDITDYSTW